MVFTRERMRDEKEYEIYKQKNRKEMEGHPIRARVLYGRHDVLEGAEVQGVVILEFPTVAEPRLTMRVLPIAKLGNIASGLMTIESPSSKACSNRNHVGSK